MNDETYDPNKPRYQEGEFQEILVAMSGLNETDAARPEQLMKQGGEHRKYLVAYIEAQLRNHREAFSGRLSKRARYLALACFKSGCIARTVCADEYRSSRAFS